MNQEPAVCAACGRPLQDDAYLRWEMQAGGRRKIGFCGLKCAHSWENSLDIRSGEVSEPNLHVALLRAVDTLGEPALDRAARNIAGYLADAAKELPYVGEVDRDEFLLSAIQSVAHGEAHNICYAGEEYADFKKAQKAAQRILVRGQPTPTDRKYADVADALIVASEAMLDLTLPGWREGRPGSTLGTGT